MTTRKLKRPTPARNLIDAPTATPRPELADRTAGERWLAENARAIAAYNESVARHGTFADGLRSF